MRNISPKHQARHLHTILQQDFGMTLSLNQAQQVTARTLGYGTWQELRAQPKPAPTPRVAFELILEMGYDDYDGFENDVPSRVESVLCRDERQLAQLMDVLLEMEKWHKLEQFMFRAAPRPVLMLPGDECATRTQLEALFYDMAAHYGVTRPSFDPDAEAADAAPPEE